MHRFFVDTAAIGSGTITLDGAVAHQMSTVLRLRPGERIALFDDTGWQYEAELERVGSVVTGRVIARSLVATEPRTKITLYQGLIRGPRFDLVLQKCTEIGVVAFVPVICDRSVVAHVEGGAGGKHDRWQRIVTEAAEQCGRGRRPVIEPPTVFRQACERIRGPAVVPWEDERALSMREFLRAQFPQPSADVADGRRAAASRPFSISIFIGPEGGFSDGEIQTARDHGVAPVSLGARILRAETAAIVASTIVLSETGDLG